MSTPTTYLIPRQETPIPLQPTAVAHADDVDLKTLLGTLAEHKWAILGGTLLFLAASVGYVLLAEPRYEATAAVQVESRPPPLLSGNTDDQALQLPAPGDAATATEIQLLTSRRVLGEAAAGLGLDVQVQPVRVPILGGLVARANERMHPGALGKPWLGLSSFGWGGEQLHLGRLQVPHELLDRPLRLTALGGGRYALRDPDGAPLGEGRVGSDFVAKDGVRLRVDTLVANRGTRFDLTRINPVTVANTLKRDIEVAEQGRSSGIIGLTYRNRDPLLAQQVLDRITRAYVSQNVARNSAEADKRLQLVNAKLPDVKKQLAEAQDALNRFQSRTGTLDVGVQNQSLLNQTLALDNNIQQLQVQLADVASKFTPAHPMYAALASQIARFRGEKAALQGRIQQLPDAQQGLYALTRDVDVTNRTYASLLDQQQLLSIARESEIGTARLIDAADVDYDTPVWPKPIPVIAGGTALGALLMACLVLMRQSFKRGVEDPMDIELLGLPVYASIPYSEKSRQIAAMPGRGRRDGRDRLLALRAPGDLAMEALRALRTSLHFAKLEMRNNVLMIAAPSPGVGKTFVCANLAVTIAQAGQRVLLIDADMRRGTLHRALGVRADGGLSDLISGRIPFEEALRKVSSAENLSFISRGIAPPNPSELLMHPRFAQLLQEASRMFDIVVIDTPPVLAVTDAAVIGHHAGASLMVVRWGMNQQREIQLAKQRLEQSGVQVRGAIFNAVQNRGAGQYAYSYYGYQPRAAA